MQNENSQEVLKRMFQRDLCSCGEELSIFAKEEDSVRHKSDFYEMLSIATLKTLPYYSKVLYTSPLTEVIWGHGSDIATLNTLLKSKPYANNFNSKLEQVSAFIKEEFIPSKEKGVQIETLKKSIDGIRDKIQNGKHFENMRLQFILLSMVGSQKGSRGNVCAHVSKDGKIMGYTITLLPMKINSVETTIQEAINICFMDMKLRENSMVSSSYRPGDSLTCVYNLGLKPSKNNTV